MKGIHEEAMVAQLWNAFEQRIGHYAHVGTNAGKQRSESCAVEHSKRMIGDGDQR